MILVIDASVTLKWFLKEAKDEQDVPQALLLLEKIRSGQHRIVQPAHWLAETLGVLVRRLPAGVSAALQSIRELNAEIDNRDASYNRAADMSLRMQHHTLDTLYHAVALEHDAILTTADERYYQLAAPVGAVERLEVFKST